MKKWSNESPFDPSLMVWFRKRLSAKILNEINEEMCRRAAQPQEEKPESAYEEDKSSKINSDDDDDEPHGGTLILDATCAPADITYPTDTGLLSEAIEKTDAMIDELHKPHIGQQPRPHTYRQKSRKVFLSFIKQRKPSKKLIRSTIRKQLGFLGRNLRFIESMLEAGGELRERRAEMLEIIQTLYAQQSGMHQQKTHKTEERIVSLSQPHIRPIQRGKAKGKTEFGAKVALSVVNGYTFADFISYNNFDEGTLLEEAIAQYKERFGMLPSKILADTIYRNRKNRAMCKDLNIHLSGLPLGRRNAEKYRQQLKEYRADCGARNTASRIRKVGYCAVHYDNELGQIGESPFAPFSVGAKWRGIFPFPSPRDDCLKKCSIIQETLILSEFVR